MYQLFQNKKPYAYAPVETWQDALYDLKAEYNTCSRSAGTEEISDIKNNSFSVTTADSKNYTYTIENIFELAK